MSVSFTDRELDVMSVLWHRGPSTAAEVREAIAGEADLAYNTVLTMLRILEEKGHVAHVEEGRAYRFRALVKQKDAGASALGRTLARLFDGSAEALVTHLVRDRGLSREEVERLRSIVDAELERDGR